jgi:prepilin-type processing-associated H-X9-DG protein
LHAFDPANGQVHWSFPWRARKYESVNAATPVVTEQGILITESYGPGGVLLQIRDGAPAPAWRDETIRDQRLSCHWCTPIVVDGFAYACHGEKVNEAELRCIELATGAIRWSEPGLGRVNLSYADGHLLCQSEGGGLFAIDATPERFTVATQLEPTRQGLSFRYPCYAAPLVSHGLLYVRDAHTLFCFDLRAH